MALARSALAGAAARASNLMAALALAPPCPFHGHGGRCQSSADPLSQRDYAIDVAVSNIRFGPGVTREVGMDAAALGAKSVVVMTDRNVARLGPLRKTLDALTAARVPYRVYDEVTVEPTDLSFQAAIAFAKQAQPDLFIAVGGGSVIDTAKAANLYYSHPAADFLEFINAPVGAGAVPTLPLRPLIAIPTTAGTGSETTGTAIFDFVERGAKTGISHRALRPTLGLVDPENTATMPPEVAAASGFDVLCHALESYTNLPFNARSPRPASPALRPAYQGANPVSDVWSMQALRLIARYFVRAVKDRGDEEANAAMTLAASFAGAGFGNAGVHLCHGLSYAISGQNKSWVSPGGYDPSVPLIPHGVSVVLTAPAVFRFTAPSNPARHWEAAQVLAGVADVPAQPYFYGLRGSVDQRPAPVTAAAAGDKLADVLRSYMQTLGVPNGLASVGYVAGDVPALVEATLPQRRLLSLVPRPTAADDLGDLLRSSMAVY